MTEQDISLKYFKKKQVIKNYLNTSITDAVLILTYKLQKRKFFIDNNKQQIAKNKQFELTTF